jgi:signal transduction histidine kinase
MSSGLALADAGLGAALLVAAVTEWRRQPSEGSRPRAALLAAAAATWEAGSLLPLGAFWHRAVVLHLALLQPTGRLGTRSRRGFVVMGYALWALPTGLPNAFVSAVAALGLFVVALGPYAVRSRGRRPGLGSALGPLLLIPALLWEPIVAIWSSPSEATIVLGYDALLIVFLGGLLAAAAVDRTRLDRLVVELGGPTGADVLRERLAAALRDPTLVVGYWLPDREVYVDDGGGVVQLPALGSGRSVTPIELDGRPLALLVHDEAVSTEAGLLEDVVAAAGWAVDNVRLRQRVREQVFGVAASRRRLVTAADDERRRLEERLRDGPQRRLARVRSLIASDPACGELVCGLDRASEELAHLATGLHPRVLTEGGLQPALSRVAELCPVPVELHVPATRLPADVESTLYFSCAEGLTNVAKYAGAAHVEVRLSVESDRTVLVVSDDGVGGAALADGSGLRGLGDRVDALGGSLAVTSPAGRGTQLTIELPLSAEVA